MYLNHLFSTFITIQPLENVKPKYFKYLEK